MEGKVSAIIASVERQMYHTNSTAIHSVLERRDNRKRTQLKFVTMLH